MSTPRTGRTIAFLVAHSGVGQVEPTTPWQDLQDAGAPTVLIAPSRDTARR